MNINKLADYLAKKSNGSIGVLEFRDIFYRFAKEIADFYWDKGYERCRSDLKNSKSFTRQINGWVINEFEQKCESAGVYSLKDLDKNKVLRDEFNEIFGCSMIF